MGDVIGISQPPTVKACPFSSTPEKISPCCREECQLWGILKDELNRTVAQDCTINLAGQHAVGAVQLLAMIHRDTAGFINRYIGASLIDPNKIR